MALLLSTHAAKPTENSNSMQHHLGALNYLTYSRGWCSNQYSLNCLFRLFYIVMNIFRDYVFNNTLFYQDIVGSSVNTINIKVSSLFNRSAHSAGSTPYVGALARWLVGVLGPVLYMYIVVYVFVLLLLFLFLCLPCLLFLWFFCLLATCRCSKGSSACGR